MGREESQSVECLGTIFGAGDSLDLFMKNSRDASYIFEECRSWRGGGGCWKNNAK